MGYYNVLSNIDTSVKLSKDDYKNEINTLGLRLSEMQRKCKDENIPVIIIFEGWSAAGKGSRISSLIRYLDPRGFEVFTTQKTTEDERLRPYLWRYWQRMPANGRIHIFDRSWYLPLMQGFRKKEMKLAYPFCAIPEFERTVVDTEQLSLSCFCMFPRRNRKSVYLHWQMTPKLHGV